MKPTINFSQFFTTTLVNLLIILALYFVVTAFTGCSTVQRGCPATKHMVGY